MEFAHIITPIANDFDSLNQEINIALDSKIPLIKQIGEYIISSGGKRLRPIVAILAARANGYVGNEHVRVAAVVEFLHTSTLLHDDVVDNSHMRRSKPTANNRWGNAAPVLVGDFLLSKAFQLITSLERIELLKSLSAATLVIAEGEVLQLTNIGNVHLTEDVYFQIIHHKTAQMFETAAELGALLGKQSNENILALKEFALQLGIAFQLVDDALDYTGDAQQMGKNLGDDLQEGKMTLPLIHSYQTGETQTRTIIENCVRKAQKEGLETLEINQIIEVIRVSEAIEYTLYKAQIATQKAKEALHCLSDSEYKSALAQLADLALARVH